MEAENDRTSLVIYKLQRKAHKQTKGSPWPVGKDSSFAGLTCDLNMLGSSYLNILVRV